MTIEPGVWQAANSRTCLVVDGTKCRVRFIMLQSTGVDVFDVPISQFQSAFKRLHGHPMESAARSMLRYGALVGVSDEARSELLKVIQQEEQTMTKRAIPRSIPRPFTPPEVPAEPKQKKTVTIKAHPVVEQIVETVKVAVKDRLTRRPGETDREMMERSYPKTFLDEIEKTTYPPTKARKYKKGALVHVGPDPKLTSKEFINSQLVAGASTEWIFEQCVKAYGFGPKQRNTINVYRHRLRATGKL